MIFYKKNWYPQALPACYCLNAMRNSEGGNRARFRGFLHGLTWEEEGEEKARGALVMSFFIHLHPHWCCDDWEHCSESKLLEWWWCWWVCTSSPAAATEEALVTHNASIANPSPPCLAQWTRKNQTPPPAADLWTQNRQKSTHKIDGAGRSRTKLGVFGNSRNSILHLSSLESLDIAAVPRRVHIGPAHEGARSTDDERQHA